MSSSSKMNQKQQKQKAEQLEGEKRLSILPFA
jgi:hypothetical protein